MASLTVEALQQHQEESPRSRKLSTVHRDGSDGVTGPTVSGPTVSGPSLRRYSRLDARQSVQYTPAIIVWTDSGLNFSTFSGSSL
jgi:hypothetical protein